MKSKLAFLHSYKQRLAFISICVVIIIISIYFNFFHKDENPQFTKVEFSELKSDDLPIKLNDFDPNTLSAKEWQELGFSEKQVLTILKYKDIVGGEFSSKNQLKKCYAISAEKFLQIEPYILLPLEKQTKQSFYENKWEKKELKISGKFNPDLYSEADWVKMGFSEKQAAGILKYKNYLGGSFVSKEKFKECFMISDDNYTKISPYLILPNKTPADFNPYKKISSDKPKIRYQNFDPNLLDLREWISLGFSEKQAQSILNYKERNLKGSFKTLEDIARCYMISPEKFEKMKPYIQLNPQNITFKNKLNVEVEKPAEKTNFSEINLNKISYQQLLEFGFDGKAAGSFVGYRKKLGGFLSKEQILETYNLDKDLAEKLLSISPLSAVNVEKYTLINAPENWLKNHPYFSFCADKIVYFRNSEKDEKKIFKKLKLKPEQIQRMKMYLK